MPIILVLSLLLSGCGSKTQMKLIEQLADMTNDEILNYWDQVESGSGVGGIGAFERVDLPKGGTASAFRVLRHLSEFAESGGVYALGDLPILAFEDSYFEAEDVKKHSEESAFSVLLLRWADTYSEVGVRAIIEGVTQVSKETGIPPVVFYAIINNERGNINNPCNFDGYSTDTLGTLREVGSFIMQNYQPGTEVGKKIDETAPKFNDYRDYVGSEVRTIRDVREIIRWMRVVEVFTNSGLGPGNVFIRKDVPANVQKSLRESYSCNYSEINFEGKGNEKLMKLRQNILDFFTIYGGGFETSTVNRTINEINKLDIIFYQKQRKIANSLEGKRLEYSRNRSDKSKLSLEIRSLERQQRSIRDWRLYLEDLYTLWGPGYVLPAS